MNKAFAIMYDLRVPGRNYTPLYEAIKKSPKWWHYLDSTWLIYTSETPSEIWNRLGSLIDKSDSLLIIEVRNNCFGWLPNDAWKWIADHALPP